MKPLAIVLLLSINYTINAQGIFSPDTKALAIGKYMDSLNKYNQYIKDKHRYITGLDNPNIRTLGDFLKALDELGLGEWDATEPVVKQKTSGPKPEVELIHTDKFGNDETLTQYTYMTKHYVPKYNPLKPIPHPAVIKSLLLVRNTPVVKADTIQKATYRILWYKDDKLDSVKSFTVDKGWHPH